MTKAKKKAKQLESLMKLGMIFAAIAGWIIFKNLQGILAMVFICFLLITGIIFYRNFITRVRLRNSGIDDIDSMAGLQFEHYLKELFLPRGLMGDAAEEQVIK